eukprot:gene13942-biopygen18598
MLQKRDFIPDHPVPARSAVWCRRPEKAVTRCSHRQLRCQMTHWVARPHRIACSHGQNSTPVMGVQLNRSVRNFFSG